MVWNRKSKKNYTKKARNPEFIETGTDSLMPEPISEEYPELEFMEGTVDPTKIVQALIHRLKCQSITAAEFCRMIGLHKNTLSRWKIGQEAVCPMSYAMLFKWIILDMDNGANFKERMIRLSKYVV